MNQSLRTMASKMSINGVLLVSSCLTTVLLLGWMAHLQNNLHQLNLQSVENADKMGSFRREKRASDVRVREARDIGDPRMDTITDLGIGGAMFTRWGRLECPADAELIYKGFIAGTHHTHTGGGSDLICVSDQPEWGKNQPGSNGHSYIYGTEFAGTGPDIIFEHTNAATLLNHDAICAVCRSTVRTSQVMIPGRLNCFSNWVKEYNGYLMSALYTAKGQASYICVDAAPEVDDRSFKAEGGVHLYPVEATCGTMPCPKYEAGKELTCVVCTK